MNKVKKQKKLQLCRQCQESSLHHYIFTPAKAPDFQTLSRIYRFRSGAIIFLKISSFHLPKVDVDDQIWVFGLIFGYWPGFLVIRVEFLVIRAFFLAIRVDFLVTNYMGYMLNLGIITKVVGQGKGKYRFV